MSFVLRQIAQRAGGGEIVRTRELTTAEPVIGRGADADIQLSDLAVNLRHARLRVTKPGRIEVEALGQSGFEVDGEEVTRAELKLADAPVVGFGAYRLTLTAEGVDIVVTVARDETADEAISTDERRVFSLAGSGVSKRGLAWGLAVLFLAIGLAFPITGYFIGREKLNAESQWSSGPLSQAHAFLEDDCQSCHVKAFVAVRDDACMSCHEAKRSPSMLQRVSADVRAKGSPHPPRFVSTHADAERLLHGTPLPRDLGGWVEAMARRAFNRPDDRCGSCHVEHGATKTKIPAMVAVNDCGDCHADLKGRLKDTDLADVGDWGKHPDFRPLVTVSPAEPKLERMALAGRPKERSGLVFPHRVHVSPTGGPARMATTLAKYGRPLDCGDCHKPDKSGRGFAPVQMERDCADCHSIGYIQVGNAFRRLPHGDPKKVEAAYRSAFGADAAAKVRAAFSEGGACIDCHTVSAAADGYRVEPVHLNDRFLPRGAFDHSLPEHRKDAKGQPLCGTCHAADKSETSADLLLASISKCADCHGKTKAQVHAPAGAECSECHSYHAPGTPARKTPTTARR